MIIALALAAPPDDFTADGALDEWPADAPWRTLDEAGRVFGEAPSSADDLAADVYLGLDAQRLVLAVRVTDDAVVLPDDPTDARQRIRSDHVELWLSLGEPPFPPLAFTNHLATTEVDAAWCQARSEDDEHADCTAWLAKQQAHRRRLAEAFARQYVLSDAGVQPVVNGELSATVAPTGFRRTDTGWVLEAELPLAHFPRVASPAVEQARVLVELVDNDVDTSSQETMVSVAPGREHRRPSTWPSVPLSAPLRLDGAAATLLAAGAGWSAPPTPGAGPLWRFHNPRVGYQWQPDAASPAVDEVSLAGAHVHTLGSGASVSLLPSGRETLLVSSGAAGGGGTATSVCTTEPVVVDAPGDALVALACTRQRGDYATGPGSAYDVTALQVFVVRPDGAVVEAVHTWGTSVDGLEVVRDGDRVAGLRMQVDGKSTARAWSDEEGRFIGQEPSGIASPVVLPKASP